MVSDARIYFLNLGKHIYHNMQMIHNCITNTDSEFNMVHTDVYKVHTRLQNHVCFSKNASNWLL